MPDSTWTGSTSNDYSTDSNWVNGVPVFLEGSISLAGADVKVAAGTTLTAGLAIGAATLEALGSVTNEANGAISGIAGTAFTIQIDAGTFDNLSNISTYGSTGFGSVAFGAGASLDIGASGGRFGYLSVAGGSHFSVGNGGTLLLGNAVQVYDANSTLRLSSPVLADVNTAGTILVGNSGTVEIADRVDAAITLQFATLSYSTSAAGGGVMLDFPSSFAATIKGFYTTADVIQLGGFFGATGPTLTFSETGGVATVIAQATVFNATRTATLHFSDPRGLYAAANATTGGFSLTSGGVLSTTTACFAQGTRIGTAHGDTAVERLRVGDAVVLADGGTAPVVWIGRRRIDCARHPRPEEVMPVRVRAGAFGAGAPSRDLLLSPEHAVRMDGALVAIHHLVNGTTIARSPIAHVTYWHVELPRHDVLLAEGLPCESYLDTGNRHAFANAKVAAMHADFAPMDFGATPCAEMLGAGPRLDAIRDALAERATLLDGVQAEGFDAAEKRLRAQQGVLARALAAAR